MKRLILIPLILFFALQTKAQGVIDRCEKQFIKYHNTEREYYLYRPDNIKNNAPLVLVLHGYGSSATKGKTRFMDLADEHGFVVCYAQGSKDFKGKRFWNVGYPFHKDCKQNDVAYLCRLVRHLQKKYHLSRKNTFLTGMSNGGEMCYLMAMKRPKMFKAIASIAGLTLSNMDRNYKYPIPFMEVHGTADKTSKWYGDPLNKGGWGEYQSVPVSISYLIAANKCKYEVLSDLPIKRHKVILHTYTGGKKLNGTGPECEVLLFEVCGGGHSWAEKDMDTCGEVWNFFNRYIE